MDKASENKKRATFEILIHIFKEASSKSLILLRSHKMMENLIKFCLSAESIPIILQDLSTLRLTVENYENFY